MYWSNKQSENLETIKQMWEESISMLSTCNKFNDMCRLVGRLEGHKNLGLNLLDGDFGFFILQY